MPGQIVPFEGGRIYSCLCCRRQVTRTVCFGSEYYRVCDNDACIQRCGDCGELLVPPFFGSHLCVPRIGRMESAVADANFSAVDGLCHGAFVGKRCRHQATVTFEVMGLMDPLPVCDKCAARMSETAKHFDMAPTVTSIEYDEPYVDAPERTLEEAMEEAREQGRQEEWQRLQKKILSEADKHHRAFTGTLPAGPVKEPSEADK